MMVNILSFKLSYHLENPLNDYAETTIPIPPDSAFQKIYYESIDPLPASIDMDSDGNWIATYKLKPRERIDVNVTGSVQIFSKEREFNTPSEEVLSNNLESNEFWTHDDPNIIAISKTLNTPKDIYDYTVNSLSYDYERVRPNIQRLGAIKALEHPDSAICMEFTDLFIALSRASGIPAREVNGYAYTENPEIQPLSLVADVLHAWPEYWDSERQAWIPVDPTWGDTTSGINYFDKLDLRHFTFVIHGGDPVKPYAPGSYKLGPNPQKDVYVNFGKLPDEKEANIDLSAIVSRKFPYFDSVIKVTIDNKGPTALYNVSPSIITNLGENDAENIEFLSPFSKKDVYIKIPFSFLGLNTPDNVSIKVQDSVVEVSSYKTIVIINSMIILFLIFTLIIVILLLAFKLKGRAGTKNENTQSGEPKQTEGDSLQKEKPSKYTKE